MPFSLYDIVSDLFHLLGSEQLKYCVLHDYDKTDGVLGSDIDICIDKQEDLVLDDMVWSYCL